MEKLNKIGCRQIAEFINQQTEFILFRMKRKWIVEWDEKNENAGSLTDNYAARLLPDFLTFSL